LFVQLPEAHLLAFSFPCSSRPRSNNPLLCLSLIAYWRKFKVTFLTSEGTVEASTALPVCLCVPWMGLLWFIDAWMASGGAATARLARCVNVCLYCSAENAADKASFSGGQGSSRRAGIASVEMTETILGMDVGSERLYSPCCIKTITNIKTPAQDQVTAGGQ
jgi:hypothetical protein